MQVVKVTAPAHFAAFCVAINEPFYYLNDAFYMMSWHDAKGAKAFCLDNGVRPCDLAKMEFSEVELNEYSGRWLEEAPSAKFRRELDELGSEADLEPFKTEEPLDAEALAAYRAHVAEVGRPDMSREAWIDNYKNNAL